MIRSIKNAFSRVSARKFNHGETDEYQALAREFRKQVIGNDDLSLFDAERRVHEMVMTSFIDDRYSAQVNCSL